MPGWDESENEWRYRFRDPGLFDKDKHVDITAGVYITYSRLRGTQKWKPQSIRFKKDNFNLTEAKKWLADHPDIRGNARAPTDYQENFVGINQKLNGVEWEDQGDVVVFRDVPITAEGVFDSPDGSVGYRSREELEKMVPFANGLRIVIRHPPPNVSGTAVVTLNTEDFPVIGFTSNAHLTELDGIARINTDLGMMKEDRAGNDRTALIEKMKKAQVRELSIGYFYNPVPEQGNNSGRDYDHLETEINPFHLAILPEAGTAQCQPPVCGIGCASCSQRNAGAVPGAGSGTGGINTTAEEEKKAREAAAAQVAAMNLQALAGQNAEVKALVEKMSAQAKELEDGKKATAALNDRVKKGDEAIAALEQQKAEARKAKIEALKEGMGEEEFGKIFPDETSLQSASDIELDRLGAMLNLSTEAETEAPAAPAPPAAGVAARSLRVPPTAAGKKAPAKPGANAQDEEVGVPDVFQPLAYRPIRAPLKED